MAQIIVGIDIGTTSIKVARLARGLRGVGLVDTVVHPVPSDLARSLAERQEEALRGALAAGRLRGEQYVVGIPAAAVSLRELELPFSDPKRIDQIAPYEVEGQIAFDLDQVVVDSVVLDRAEREKKEVSRVLAAALPKGALTDTLALLHRVGIEPYAVDLDGLSLARVYADYSRSRDGVLWLLEMGNVKSVVCCLRGGKVAFLRGFWIGGADLTAALAKELSLSLEEAEQIKREIDLSDRKDPRSEILRKALEPWFFEVERGLRLGNLDGAHALPLGGAGALRGFSDVLAERLSLPKVDESGGPLGIDSASLGLGVSGLEKITASEGPFLPLALGLALRSDRSGEMNFRKGEFAFGKALAEERARWVSIGLTLLLVCGLLFGNFYLRYHLKASRLEGLRMELRDRFAKAFPQVRSAGPEVDQARSAIDGLKRTAAFLGVGELTPLVILREISTTIPKQVPIEVQDLVIDQEKVRMEALTDSFESIDRVKAALIKVPFFSDVSVSDAKVGADPTKVSFRIQFRGAAGSNP